MTAASEEVQAHADVARWLGNRVTIPDGPVRASFGLCPEPMEGGVCALPLVPVAYPNGVIVRYRCSLGHSLIRGRG